MWAGLCIHHVQATYTPRDGKRSCGRFSQSDIVGNTNHTNYMQEIRQHHAASYDEFNKGIIVPSSDLHTTPASSVAWLQLLLAHPGKLH